MKYECSRCGIAFKKEDQDLLIRISRHDQGRHKIHNVIGQRPYHKHPDGSPEKLNKSMGGMDIGLVEWKEINDET